MAPILDDYCVISALPITRAVEQDLYALPGQQFQIFLPEAVGKLREIVPEFLAA
jgi:hypothetical protein